jgi:AbrB family looped-hinge helix DNA binding protein
MRVNSKGVVTIPAKIRKQLGMLPGTEVEFVIRADSVHLIKRKLESGCDSKPERRKLPKQDYGGV